MQPMSHAAGRELRWVQPRFGHRWWELRALNGSDGHPVAGDAGLYAVLGWKRRFHRIADIETASARWRLSRPRLFSRDIQVVNAETSAPEATVRWSGLAWKRTAHLHLANGREYKFWPSHFLSGEYAIAREESSTESDNHLITFHRHFHAFHTENGVVIAANAAQLPDTALLVALGWYMRLAQMQRRRHVAMAT